MSRSRFLVVFVVFAVFASVCGSSNSSSSSSPTTATQASTSVGGSSAGFRDALTAAGVEIIDFADAERVNGFQILSFQVENMEREIDVGSGITGFDLDRMAGAPGGMPFSYLIAGWITGAGTPAAEAAGEIMGDQDWQVAPFSRNS